MKSQSKTPQNAGGQENDCFDQTKSPFDSHSSQSEWKQEEPDKRIQHKSGQCKRPAEHQKYEPQKKFRHMNLLC